MTPDLETFTDYLEDRYSEVPPADEIPKGASQGEERRACHKFILNKIDCAGEGRRDLDLELGDIVYWNQYHLKRETLFASTDKPTMRFWRKTRTVIQDGMDCIRMRVVGARTLQSGQRKEKVVGPYDQGRQAYLDVWRTHRVIIVTAGLRRKHYKALSNDIMLQEEVEG